MVPFKVPQKSGVYALIFADGSRYIGGSKNMRARIYTHMSWLRKGGGQTKELQEAFNRFGDPDIQVVKLCLPEQIKFFEDAAYEKYKPTLCKKSYGGTAGVTMTEKAKANMSAAAKLKDQSCQSKRQLETWKDPKIRAARIKGLTRFSKSDTQEAKEARLEQSRKMLITRRARHGY